MIRKMNDPVTRGLNVLSGWVLRTGAVILIVSAVVVLGRGYLRIGDGREYGLHVYLFAMLAVIYAVVLWKYGRKR